MDSTCKYFINGGFFYIQDLSSDGKNGLIIPVAAVFADPPAESPSTIKSRTEMDPFSHSWQAFHWNQRNISAL